MMLNLNHSCKDCKERHIGCHSTCSKDIEARDRNLEIKRAMIADKEAEFYISSKNATFKDLKNKGRQIARRKKKQ